MIDTVADGLSVINNRNLANQDIKATKSGYYSDTLNGIDEDSKHKQRVIVADFLKVNRDHGAKLRILTLPGARWEFERGHFDESVQFVGIEKNQVVYSRAIPWMPINWKKHNINITCRGPNGSVGVIYGISDLNSKKGRGSYLNCWLSAYLTMNLGRSKNTEKSIRYRNCRISASWIDITSPVSCDEFIQSMTNLTSVFSKSIGTIPVVVSYCARRDTRQLLQFLKACGASRSDYVSELLNTSKEWSFQKQDVFSYTTDRSNGNSTLETVLFLGKRKRAYPGALEAPE